MGQGVSRARRIGFKTGTSYGFRDAWAAGFSNDYTVGVWVGFPSGAPRPGRMGRDAAAPILLKVFDLLPPDVSVAPSPPAGAILATRTEQLPPGLRFFARPGAVAAAVPRVPPPRIAFPPDGAVVSLPQNDDEHRIALNADGGRAPLTWMVNGAVLGTYGRYQQALLEPDGEGLARITVIDAEGRSATSRVRFKRPRE
jgi:penicillin-binding protein 1C